MAYESRYITHIDAPVDRVWEWMTDARNVLGVNIFHEAVEWDDPITEAGPRVPIPHNFYGMKRQLRIAHVRDYRKYFIGFSETMDREERGVDPFPHYQAYELAQLSDGTCLVVNYIRGVYQVPGARYFGARMFHYWMPRVQRDDNANVAIAVGALGPEEKPRLKTSVWWLPALASTARFLGKGKTARRKPIKPARSSRG